jgi:hypothetical protein
MNGAYIVGMLDPSALFLLPIHSLRFFKLGPRQTEKAAATPPLIIFHPTVLY